MTSSNAASDDGDRSRVGGGRGTQRVAVVTDGSGFDPRLAGDRSLADVLAADVAVIGGLAKVPVASVVVLAEDGAELAARVRQLPEDIAAAYLTRTEPARARTAQRLLEMAGGRQAFAEEDDAAIMLTAACLSYLRRIDRDPITARVLIAGAARMPTLAALLMACEIFDVSLWNLRDERWFPLPRAVRDADVVIDLLGGTNLAGLVQDRPEGSVILHEGLSGRALAAPGILRALTCYPPGAVGLDVGLYRDCALAVAAVTPRRIQSPTPLLGPYLVDTVEAAVHIGIRRDLPDRL
jgi:hypothetical protein